MHKSINFPPSLVGVRLLIGKIYKEMAIVRLVMESRTQRLAALVIELRGDLSQRQFAKKFGVSFSAIHSWESGTSWPGTQNLTRLAQLKGWSFDELQYYLEGEPLSPRLSVPQLLAEVRSLPFEAAAQVARVALETMSNKGEPKAC